VNAIKDGEGQNARFSNIAAAALDGDGTLFVCDGGNRSIRVIDQKQSKLVICVCQRCSVDVSTLAAGGGSRGSFDSRSDGPLSEAMFGYPSSISVAPNGLIYVADRARTRILVINRSADTVSTLVGSTPGHQDGFGERAQLFSPCSIVHRDGLLYVSDESVHCLRCVDVATSKAAWVT
jgi:hypothetical protein